MSGDSYPTLALVWPVLSKLIQFVDKRLEKVRHGDLLLGGLLSAKKVLEKYLNLIKQSDGYAIATILDPQFKDKFFDCKLFSIYNSTVYDSALMKLKVLIKDKMGNIPLSQESTQSQ